MYLSNKNYLKVIITTFILIYSSMNTLIYLIKNFYIFVLFKIQ